MEKLQLRDERELSDYQDTFERSKGYYLLKKVMDIIGSSLGILLLSPLMLITAVAIKLESEGPIFFGQDRVGHNGKIFRMYKFRSMVVNAEEVLIDLKAENEMSGPMFKIKEDPRITKVGKLIRKTSIDELPQLINILKGNMSLVGPRPNLQKEVTRFNKFQKLKLYAKPGLTCYWQVMGRNNIDFEEWMELDIKYIEERSTLGDIKLIFMTVGVLFGDEDAS